MERDHLKSDYCTNSAAAALEDLIANINAKYILLSYNNMAQKGNGRSNAKISDADIRRILEKKGAVKVFSREHKPFSAGKSDIVEHEERLFLCVCASSISSLSNETSREPFIQSPLNYTGGKHKLLPQLLPLFPARIGTFVDLFCGGCNVGINVAAGEVIFNDKDKRLHYFFETLRNLEKETVFARIDEIISQYNLSRSDEKGYKFYGCESSSGLGKFNQKGFLKLRADFNKKNEDYDYYVMLFVLIIYAFNNQIRFNTAGEFNLPVGKRDFNGKMKEKLSALIDRLQAGNYQFSGKDFREFDISKLSKNTLFYCDPPYLITCATYNENDGWTEKDERDLLEFLDKLNAGGFLFALSNVLVSKGRKNEILSAWLSMRKYNVHHLKNTYANSNYQTKDRSSTTDEVLVCNY